MHTAHIVSYILLINKKCTAKEILREQNLCLGNVSNGTNTNSILYSKWQTKYLKNQAIFKYIRFYNYCNLQFSIEKLFKKFILNFHKIFVK